MIGDTKYPSVCRVGPRRPGGTSPCHCEDVNADFIDWLVRNDQGKKVRQLRITVAPEILQHRTVTHMVIRGQASVFRGDTTVDVLYPKPALYQALTRLLFRHSALQFMDHRGDGARYIPRP